MLPSGGSFEVWTGGSAIVIERQMTEDERKQALWYGSLWDRFQEPRSDPVSDKRECDRRDRQRHLIPREACPVAKPKRKLTSAERAAKEKRQREYMTIFIGGKQKRVKRPPMIEGISVEEFIRRNADPIWLHQEGLWEYMEPKDEDDEEF